MLAVVTYLLTMDHKTWDAFRARLKRESRKVKDVLPALIHHYIRHGLPEDPRAK